MMLGKWKNDGEKKKETGVGREYCYSRIKIETWPFFQETGEKKPQTNSTLLLMNVFEAVQL